MLGRGGQLVYHAADLALPTLMRVQLPRSTWSGVVAVSPGRPPERLTVVRPGLQHFAISLEHRRLPTGGSVVALYCQYWMVNLTGLNPIPSPNPIPDPTPNSNPFPYP